jgi:NitT/TauT family transport system substrate-binding protein
MAEPVHIEFSRFSAFYSPLIAAIAGGFLKDEGFAPTYAVSTPGKPAIEAVLAGKVQVIQSAPSQGIIAQEKKQDPGVLHFAQINEMDGFFLTGRKPEPDFKWSNLKGKRILVEQGSAQPLAMFKYACFKSGIRYEDIEALNIPTSQMSEAFSKGEGDYVHQQGPYPQQLEFDKVGHVVTSVGKAIGPVSFSSLAATPAWLKTDSARRFTRAYRKARAWLLATPAAEVAKVEASYFPKIDQTVLANTIATYQTLGSWTPHVEITREAFEAVNDVFLHSKGITKRYPYESVVAPPPA